LTKNGKIFFFKKKIQNTKKLKNTILIEEKILVIAIFDFE